MTTALFTLFVFIGLSGIFALLLGGFWLIVVLVDYLVASSEEEGEFDVHP